MESLEQVYENCKTLLEKSQYLIDSPLVNFYEDNYWQSVVDLKWDQALLSLPDAKLALLPDSSSFRQSFEGLPDSFVAFLNNVADCSLPVSNMNHESSHNLVNLGMNPKKQHEVLHMSPLAMHKIKQHNIDQVIDFGSGKGYLPEHIALCSPGTSVVGIDKSEQNTAGALKRNNLMSKLWYPLHKKNNPVSSTDGQNLNHYVPLTIELKAEHADEHFVSTIAKETHFLQSNRDTMLVGLHACGDLTSYLLQTFVLCGRLKCLVSVGCCYHYITQRQPTATYMLDGGLRHYPAPRKHVPYAYPLSWHIQHDPIYFSRNALNLAQQAPEKSAVEGRMPGDNIFHRAVFQVIINSYYPNADVVNVGRNISSSSTFTEYCHSGFKKLGLPTIPHYELELLYQEYLPRKREIFVFYQLRMLLSRVIESVLIIDRILYLKENDVACEVVKLFDPTISPRAYAIIAEKK